MRNNIALLHLLLAFTLCILTELKGHACAHDRLPQRLGSLYRTLDQRLYPNPAFDRLYIAGNIPSSAQMTLFNSVGQRIETGFYRPFIEVSGFAEGIYFLRLEIDGTTIQKAFTILQEP